MIKRALILSWFVSLALAGTAFAQDDEEEIDPTLEGVYLGAAVGAGFEQFDGAIDYTTSPVTSVLLGYRASEYISIETEVDYFNGYSQKPIERDDIVMWMWTLNFRVHIPLGRFEPYLKYGGGVLDVDGSRGTTATINSMDAAFVGGGGLAYHWTDSLSMYAEATHALAVGAVDGFDNTSVRFGFIYKFLGEEEE